ncbi:ABC transporter permease [Kibdelosporangium persicum]|uniref:Binding-protein-dependent transport systems inner membrane component n=1 Tax=Kibdelosporangium persicum TaxID=2698649 RepID=A0ABX2F924_9PSEU|nr:ABC transporter permease [Kibdelosporangium persicum]NRN67856.1 Binding-protein-dependent transport systems inner membrane component [Kibdelosporangium persicum]
MTDPGSVGGGGPALESFASAEVADLATTQSDERQRKPRSLWGDAWHQLRRKPMFAISAVIILVVVLMAAFPSLFTARPADYNNLDFASQPPSASAWFGYSFQGYDIWARAVHGARATLLVGFFATLLTVLIGSVMGIIAGFYGRLTDAFISRFGDVFAGLPFVLGAIVILTTFNPPGSEPSGTAVLIQVILSISVLSWPVSMRIMRSATIVAKQLDYVKAARALGASTRRIIFRHMLPNTVAPVLVYATIALGAFIAVEATLAYLGIGVRPPVVSWGVMINDGKDYVQTSPHELLFPAGLVTITVLAFVMLGDAVRDALDPKSR